MKNKVKHCNFCGNSKHSLLYDEYDHLVRCDSCGLVFLVDQMTLSGMKNFYGKDYFVSEDANSKGYEHYFNSRDNIIKTFTKRMKIIEKYCSSPGKVLDIGCAAGFFLEVTKERGWENCGVDISKLCADYARSRLGVDIHNDLFLNVELNDGTFDLITMWDYLEHSITPKEDILKASALLKEQGLLVIAVPDIGSIPARIFRSNWIGIKLERAFLLFFKENFRGFISKKWI